MMYDSTIVVLFAHPGFDGDVYYTQKSNYSLNLQVSSIFFHYKSDYWQVVILHKVGNTPSNLRIVDYSHGFTGSAHDATAFEHTAAHKHPDWFFKGEEFAWADSAYSLNKHTIPVHHKPASFWCQNTIFDKAIAHIHVCSEHCMGALKGCFQCLWGLCVNINSLEDHIHACCWITISIILHNLIIDVEGTASDQQFQPTHPAAQEEVDTGVCDEENSEENAEEVEEGDKGVLGSEPGT